MSRKSPYITKDKTWDCILNMRLEIPMNQRQYEWDEKNIKIFINDLIEVYHENEYKEKMGTLIFFTNEDGVKEIWDGQQRTITIIILLSVISRIYEKDMKKKINSLLLIDEDDYEEEQNRLIDEYSKLIGKVETDDEESDVEIVDYNSVKIPKIKCINHFDDTALLDIFNSQYNSIYEYIEFDEEEIDSDEEEDDEIDKYICKLDGKKIKQKNFKAYLEKNYDINFTPRSKNSKIYKGFDTIYNILVRPENREKIRKIKDFYKFIIEDIELLIFESTDIKYVSKIFEWENNRGKGLNELDILKNKILTLMPNDKRNEVFERWSDLKLREDLNVSKFGEKIFNISLQLYLGEIQRTTEYNDFYNKIKNEKDQYKSIKSFFRINDKIYRYYQEIKEDKYGCLITKTKRVNIAWEGYMFLILPISYLKNKVDFDLIRLLVKWCYRNIGQKIRSFNNLAYSNGLINITNKVFENKDYDYLTAVRRIIIHNTSEYTKNKSTYIEGIEKRLFKSTIATYLLYFLETVINTDNNIVTFNNTLEHIVPRKERDSYKDEIHKIGNLTLLEGKNSENGHKGNSSIQNKGYEHKRQSYIDSSVKLTNIIGSKYDIFSKDEITERTKELAILIHDKTDYIS